jgi:hypothetical protein
MIEPYKGRTVDLFRRVEVYRNLSRPDGPWYSVRQGGRVIGHTKDIELNDCFFIVQQGGRRKVIATGRKNVHAWIYGRIKIVDYGPLVGPLTVKYNPYHDKSFVYITPSGDVAPILSAVSVHINGGGVTAWKDP